MDRYGDLQRISNDATKLKPKSIVTFAVNQHGALNQIEQNGNYHIQRTEQIYAPNNGVNRRQSSTHVTVIKGHKFPTKDHKISGTHLYVKVKCGNHEFKTKTISTKHDGVEAEWNETFRVHNANLRELVFEVYDEDIFSNDHLIGRCVVALDPLRNGDDRFLCNLMDQNGNVIHQKDGKQSVLEVRATFNVPDHRIQQNEGHHIQQNGGNFNQQNGGDFNQRISGQNNRKEIGIESGGHHQPQPDGSWHRLQTIKAQNDALEQRLREMEQCKDEWQRRFEVLDQEKSEWKKRTLELQQCIFDKWSQSQQRDDGGQSDHDDQGDVDCDHGDLRRFDQDEYEMEPDIKECLEGYNETLRDVRSKSHYKAFSRI